MILTPGYLDRLRPARVQHRNNPSRSRPDLQLSRRPAVSLPGLKPAKNAHACSSAGPRTRLNSHRLDAPPQASRRHQYRGQSHHLDAPPQASRQSQPQVRTPSHLTHSQSVSSPNRSDQRETHAHALRHSPAPRSQRPPLRRNPLSRTCLQDYGQTKPPLRSSRADHLPQLFPSMTAPIPEHISHVPTQEQNPQPRNQPERPSSLQRPNSKARAAPIRPCRMPHHVAPHLLRPATTRHTLTEQRAPPWRRRALTRRPRRRPYSSYSGSHVHGDPFRRK